MNIGWGCAFVGHTDCRSYRHLRRCYQKEWTNMFKFLTRSYLDRKLRTDFRRREASSGSYFNKLIFRIWDTEKIKKMLRKGFGHCLIFDLKSNMRIPERQIEKNPMHLKCYHIFKVCTLIVALPCKFVLLSIICIKFPEFFTTNVFDVNYIFVFVCLLF